MHMQSKILSALALPMVLFGCGGAATEGDDGGASCQEGFCILTGTITSHLTLTADREWLLRGGVFVGNDADETILTVEPGTTVYGEKDTQGMLVVTRGSKLIARGEPTAPIVFTSSQELGRRARGDWGGIVLNGRAPINCGTPPCEGYGEGGTGFFGGDDPEDSSGVLEYVRVEFAGQLISPDNELNGIAFQGVGSGTVVDQIQVHMNADDGVEFFGGTVNVKHVLLTGIGDDSLDWTDGWRGMGQFIVAQQYDDNSDNGIEADNNAELNDAIPRAQPILSNLTLIGSPSSDKSDVGILLREGTAGHISNAIVIGFHEGCLDLSDTATFTQAQAGALTMASSLLDCQTPFVEDGSDPFTVQSFFEAMGTDNQTADPQLVAPFDAAAPNFAPQPGSLATSGATIPADPFFEAVTFRGGVDPSDDWTQGWTTDDRD